MNACIDCIECIDAPAQDITNTQLDTVITDRTDRDLLAQWGFTAEEMSTLLWLRRWYQAGNINRAAITRYLAFLKLLVRSGELEL